MGASVQIRETGVPKIGCAFDKMWTIPLKWRDEDVVIDLSVITRSRMLNHGHATVRCHGEVVISKVKVLCYDTGVLFTHLDHHDCILF